MQSSRLKIRHVCMLVFCAISAIAMSTDVASMGCDEDAIIDSLETCRFDGGLGLLEESFEPGTDGRTEEFRNVSADCDFRLQVDAFCGFDCVDVTESDFQVTLIILDNGEECWRENVAWFSTDDDVTRFQGSIRRTPSDRCTNAATTVPLTVRILFFADIDTRVNYEWSLEYYTGLNEDS